MENHCIKLFLPEVKLHVPKTASFYQIAWASFALLFIFTCLSHRRFPVWDFFIYLIDKFSSVVV